MIYEYESGVRSAVHVEKEINKSAATSHQVSRIHYSDGRKLQYDYDDMERITRVVDSVADITEYTHDDSNNKAFLCHPAPRHPKSIKFLHFHLQNATQSVKLRHFF